MSKQLRENLPHLQTIASVKDKKLQLSLLKYFSKKKSFKKALREISKNLIKGNVPLSKYRKSLIKKHRKNIYAVAYNNRIDSDNLSKQVIQTGGWLWIIPIIASLSK